MNSCPRGYSRSTTRIDVHHHFLPRVWLDEMARHPEQPPMPQDWNVGAAMA